MTHCTLLHPWCAALTADMLAPPDVFFQKLSHKASEAASTISGPPADHAPHAQPALNAWGSLRMARTDEDDVLGL